LRCTAHGVQSRRAGPESWVLNKKQRPCMALCAQKWRPSRRSGVQKAAVSARQCVAVWEAADGGGGVRGVTRVGAAKQKALLFIYIVDKQTTPNPPRRARCKAGLAARPLQRATPRMRTHAAARRAAAAAAPPRALLTPSCVAVHAHAARRASAAAAMLAAARAHGRRSTAPRHCPRRACRGERWCSTPYRC